MAKNSRGGKRVAGGSSSRRLQADHYDAWNPPPSVQQQLADANNIPIDDAYKQVSALEHYSGIDYGDIRDAFYENKTDSPYYKDALELEKFIEQSPKWKGGELYRGVRLSQHEVDSLQVGGRIDMKGMSSWSSQKSVADNFAYPTSTRQAVIFKTARTKKGASITHLSTFGKAEYEVLVSGKATWTVKKMYKEYDKLIVEVKEN